MPEEPGSYREFWPFYVRAHSRPWTRRCHMAATMAGVACAVVAAIARDPWLVPLPVVVAYAIAVPSHFLFEGNRPTMRQHPLWSAFADMHMCALMLIGRMDAEVTRHGRRAT